VKDALRKLPDRLTVVLVAHRLSSIADVDRVILMADGHVVASGPHAELLQTSDAYRALVQEQLLPE
jgi:ABC-type multidrug transport system fused ATPase/permease subunit